jgi:putative hydrolase of HD superfamily
MILDFLKDSANLKSISRQGWIDKLSIKNPESVADHSYSMAIMAMIISDLENYDSEKILKMTLIHDLAESKIGDITPEQMTPENKMKIENDAFNEIIDQLPETVKSQYLEIWKEYQNNNSKESLFVHQIDKLEMALQAKIYQKDGKTIEDIEPFLESAKRSITDKKLKEIFTKIIEE